MIPKHLQGKSAAEIVEGVRNRFLSVEAGDAEFLRKSYFAKLEALLLLAIKDALCNANDEKGTLTNYVGGVEGRAIAFLNTVLPKKWGCE